jgi:hypothetical protein
MPHDSDNVIVRTRLRGCRLQQTIQPLPRQELDSRLRGDDWEWVWRFQP